VAPTDNRGEDETDIASSQYSPEGMATSPRFLYSASMTANAGTSAPVLVLMPLYNDWESVRALLPQLDAALASSQIKARLLIVDDGSSEPCPSGLVAAPLSAIGQVDLLQLRRNLGHQRAIAIGLAHAAQEIACEAVVVMDSDGEDLPADVPRLIQAMRDQARPTVVFAQRTRRSEDWLFKLFYWGYRMLHLVLTGIRVRVGNFSALPAQLLQKLVVSSELWNHFAAAIFRLRLPFAEIATRRGKRLAGRSRMNFVALVTHGLSALSVFGDIVGVRLLIASALVMALALAGLLSVVAIRLSTDLAIPGWASVLGAVCVLVILQGAAIAALFVFIVLSSRSNLGFLPLRDHRYFVQQCSSVWPVSADER